MSLKDLFSKNTFDLIIDFIRATILELAQENIPNFNKKVELDKQVSQFIKDKVIAPVNFPGPDMIIDQVLGKIVDHFVPVLTQKVYDLLKEQVSI